MSTAVERPPVLVCPGFAQDVRWRPGERLEQLFEARCDVSRDDLAVDAGGETLTYGELDDRANRLARHLLARGAGPGRRVALLLDDPVDAYVGMLAVLKAGAAYVPLDAAFPPDRLAYIVADAEAGVVVSRLHLSPRLGEVQAEVVCIDAEAAQISAWPDCRPSDAERGAPVDELAYVIYTSGSTGRPKGVAIAHGSICNFVRVATEVYGVRPGDRMYQGLTIAFDFSVEEIWVSWLAGAVLVPKPAGSTLLGLDLHAFLTERRVTALCCVPTLLATLDEDLPDLRFLLVSGEACPHDLIVRWHRPGRRFLNVYGPTEATVTATWTVVDPDRPVTIGVPLPTYSAVILDPEDPGRALPLGEVGEIGIAGIGLAVGYVNRDDLTAKAFVPDFLGIAGNPSGRIYRTGDLGRVDADGEIEYLGRIDLQVKIRGYRIELTEIESALLQVPGIAQAVVDTYESTPGTLELVGYYSLRHDVDEVDHGAVIALLRTRLPAYMVPAYLEHLPVIPMTTSDKADRKRLPPPTRRIGAAEREWVAPASTAEEALAELLASTLGVDAVSVTSHFFEDLGANSLLMARFSARVRQVTDLPPLSMRDIYLNPTIRALAAALAQADDAPSTPRAQEVVPAGTLRYVLCGSAQLLLFLAHTCAMAVVFVVGLEWMVAADGFLELWRRGLAFSVGTFLVLATLPIVAKWLLVGRWKVCEFPLWSLRYLRFWTVKLLLRANPMAAFVGSPLYNVYLRALGARVGRGVVVLSRNLPVCTDLLTIGDGSVIRKDSYFTGYRAYAGRIETGTVILGSDVVVSEQTVLEIDSSMGDGAQLGHASSLQRGQHVPAGQSWHGSPAQPCDVDYRIVAPARCGPLRRFAFSAAQLVNVLLLYVPLGLALVLSLLERLPILPQLLAPGQAVTAGATFYLEVLTYTTAVFVAGLLLGLAYLGTVPRLFNLGLRADTVYPLYGIRYWLQRRIAGMTNSRFFTYLFGDSSAIVHYLRFLGYDLGRRPIEQSGSNFGVEVRHESPYLCRVGAGTMVSDGLSFMNADYSSTSFRIARASLGERSFLGNNIAYPADGRTGDNCLLATKVMVPIAGQVRADVGLLGSPPFEIPRSVQRDSAFDHLKVGDERRRRLRAKNRHNAVTAGMYLLANIVHLYVVAVIGLLALDYYFRYGIPVVAAATVATLVFSVGYFVLLERAVTSFRSLRPQFCSIYDPYFWWHERFWKMSAGTYLALFNGTPMKNLLWRALGVRIGRKVFDDGCAVPEKSLVTIGDHVSLNVGSTIQAHSLEDGTFKSDRIVIGRGCTLGTNAFVHYGVTLHEGSVLDPDSFLMKGGDVPAGAQWGGNPASEVRDGAIVVPVPPARASRALAVAAAVPVAAVAGLAAYAASGAQAAAPPSLMTPVAAPPALAGPPPAAGTPSVTRAPAPVAAPPAPAGPPPAAGTPSAPRASTPVAAPPAIPVELGHGGYFGLPDLPRLEVGLRMGEQGREVANTQVQLQRLGYYPGPVHGLLDNLTGDAVRRFQVDVRVLGDPGGTVGRATALALLASGERRRLTLDSTGEDVHRLQHALMVALGRRLAMDGSFGPETHEALHEYQRTRGLAVTGEVDIRTWIALEGGR